MTDSRPPRPARRLSAAQIIGGVTVVSALFGAVIGYFLSRDGGPGTFGRELFAWGFIAVMAVAAAVTIPYWRRLDEAAREAHKSAWMWGGGAAFTLAAALGAFMMIAPPDLSMPSFTQLETSNGRFADGIFFAVGLQSIAYGLGWLIWWQRRR